jgi:SAM-dependent methyltransferase
MNRSPFQGVITVVRFNWHLYAIALFAAATLIVISSQVPAWIAPHSRVVASLILLSTGLSLAATWLAYDSSELYALKWLRPWIPAHGNAANIHAGFDETTLHLRATFPNLNWRVFDFYDPAHHTEVSIRRARRSACPPADTVSISTHTLPVAPNSLDRVLLMLAAHEIRDPAERTAFFAELYRALAPDGLLIITEHLRDLPNIAAYNLGAWHFHSRSTWYTAFAASHFDLVTTFRPAPFITTFILKKHGSST